MPKKKIKIGQRYTDITANLTLEVVSIDATYNESWSVWDVRIAYEILENAPSADMYKSVHNFGMNILEGALVLQDGES